MLSIGIRTCHLVHVGMVRQQTWFGQRNRILRWVVSCMGWQGLRLTNSTAGGEVGGALFPLILPPLIERFGVMKTTRAYAICILICLVPALPLMKARLPESRVHGPAPRSSNRKWLRNSNFWFFIAMNTIQSLGYFIPTTWLPSM